MSCLRSPSKYTEGKGHYTKQNYSFYKFSNIKFGNMDSKTESQNVQGDTEILSPVRTAESVLLPIPRDTFEKLYLTPKMPIAGNLRRTFGNPTPISLMGFLVSATPNAMLHMGWRGAGGDGGAIL